MPSHRTSRPRSAELRQAAHLFDAVRYGHLPATESGARQVVAVESAIAAARPIFPPLMPTGSGVAP